LALFANYVHSFLISRFLYELGVIPGVNGHVSSTASSRSEKWDFYVLLTKRTKNVFNIDIGYRVILY
jgi:hypothetical protein